MQSDFYGRDLSKHMPDSSVLNRQFCDCDIPNWIMVRLKYQAILYFGDYICRFLTAGRVRSIGEKGKVYIDQIFSKVHIDWVQLQKDSIQNMNINRQIKDKLVRVGLLFKEDLNKKTAEDLFHILNADYSTTAYLYVKRKALTIDFLPSNNSMLFEDEINLPNRIKSALRRGSVYFESQIKSMTDREILALREIGEKGLSLIRAVYPPPFVNLVSKPIHEKKKRYHIVAFSPVTPDQMGNYQRVSKKENECGDSL